MCQVRPLNDLRDPILATGDTRLSITATGPADLDGKAGHEDFPVLFSTMIPRSVYALNLALNHKTLRQGDLNAKAIV